MTFGALCEDVVLRVLSQSDVYTTLSVSAVNKSLRCVALTKQLWLSLVQDLGVRGVLDLPAAEELETYSTTDLVNHVKRVVVGPEGWLPGYHATLHRQLEFDAAVEGQHLVDFRLLPSGRHTMLQTRKDLRICEVGSGSIVWKLSAHYRDTTWSVHLMPGGEIARVVVLPVSQPMVIAIHEVNLTRGKAREKFTLNLPTTLLRWMPSIQGDFFLFALQPEDSAIMIFMLVNWREETYVVLDYGGRSYSMNQAILIPGHIVATYSDSTPPHQQLLTVVTLDSLSPYWRPLSAIDLDTRLLPRRSGSGLLLAVHERLEWQGEPLCNATLHLKLSAFPSPLHDDAHKIVIYACGEAPVSAPMPAPAAIQTPTTPTRLGARVQVQRLFRRVTRLGLGLTHASSFHASASHTYNPRRSSYTYDSRHPPDSHYTPAPATHPTQPPEAPAALLSFRLSRAPVPGAPVGWRLTSAVPAAPGLADPRISYAGYCLNVGDRGEEWLPGAGSAVVDVRRERQGASDQNPNPNRYKRATWTGTGYEMRTGGTRTVLKREESWKRMRLTPGGAVVGLVGSSSIVVSYYK
ncbi:hypothetical protein DFH06DRAFT_1442429 [Mycena polygramma]|nr:hypothetical protein DFH06DRAFT_1442429 [Mycena polygramma]